jgi:hypothetical protein
VEGVGEQRLRHINDSVLSSLKMEGIRFYYLFHCIQTPSGAQTSASPKNTRAIAQEHNYRDIQLTCVYSEAKNVWSYAFTNSFLSSKGKGIPERALMVPGG